MLYFEENSETVIVQDLMFPPLAQCATVPFLCLEELQRMCLILETGLLTVWHV